MTRDESRDVRVEFNTEYDEYDDAHEIVSDVEWHDGELDTHRHKRYVPHSQLVEAERQLSECREQALPWLEWGEAIAEKAGATVGDSIFAKVKEYVSSLEHQLAESRAATDALDSELTKIRVALTAAGIPEVEPYPEEDVSDWERSLRAGGRVICATERIKRLAESRAEVERLRDAIRSALESFNDGDDTEVKARLLDALEPNQ